MGGVKGLLYHCLPSDYFGKLAGGFIKRLKKKKVGDEKKLSSCVQHGEREFLPADRQDFLDILKKASSKRVTGMPARV